MLKKRFLAGCLALLFGSSAQPLLAQEGAWAGELKVGANRLQLVFHFGKEGCTLDSPDQGVRGIEVKKNEVPSPTLSLSIPSIGATYKGVWMGNKIMGTFVQHGYEIPLTLQPGANLHKRPQTPKAPFPYATEEVSFSNGDAVLKGTLSLPKGYTKSTPVVLMVTGSGLQNRDEEVFEHKPFAVIADAFARHGIATLRYDDRGFGASTGDLQEVTTQDLQNDALAGLRFLRQRFDHVGILGHSEGGTIGLLLAADRQVDFVVSLAAMVVSGKETLLAQNRSLLQRLGVSTAVTEDYLKVLEQLFSQAMAGEVVQLSQHTTLPENLQANLQQVVQSLQLPYLPHFLKMEAAKSLDKIQCPVLALNGTKDTQVDGNRNLPLLQKGISSAQSQVKACEGLNHLFQTCQTGNSDEYPIIEETFSPAVIDLMIQWITQLKW